MPVSALVIHTDAESINARLSVYGPRVPLANHNRIHFPGKNAAGHHADKANKRVSNNKVSPQKNYVNPMDYVCRYSYIIIQYSFITAIPE